MSSEFEKPTIYEVAERAGVSIASVSRVLQNKPGVSEATRKMITSIMEELGYIPSNAARGLAGCRAGIIGLIFPDLDDPSMESGHETLLYFDEIIRGAQRAARQEGIAVLIAATHSASGRELALSIASKVDGLVIMARSVPEVDMRSLATRIPTVLLAAERHIPGTDYLIADNEGGSAAVTRHLVKYHGYPTVMFFGGPSNSPDSRARFRGYCKELALGNLEVPKNPWMTGDFTEASGRRIAKAILLKNSLPRAVVVGNDQMAFGMMKVLISAGVKVPQEVAITGFDDLPVARYLHPGLTTVRQPMRELGAQSIQLLLTRLGGSTSPQSVVLPTELILRKSCGCTNDDY